MDNQNQTSDANQRAIIVPAVAKLIRSGNITRLRQDLPVIARESGRAVPEIEKFYIEVKDNKILTQFGANQNPTHQDELTRYEPVAAAFWRYFAKNNLLDTIVDQPEQFAREINADPTVVRQVFAQQTSRTASR